MSTLNSKQTSRMTYYLSSFLLIVVGISFLTPWLPIPSFLLACLVVTPIAIGMRLPSDKLPLITQYPVRRAKSHYRLTLYITMLMGSHLLIHSLNFLLAGLGVFNPLPFLDLLVVGVYIFTCIELAYTFIKHSLDADAHDLLSSITIVCSLSLCMLYTFVELYPLIAVYLNGAGISIPVIAQISGLPLFALVIPLAFSAIYNLSLASSALPEIKRSHSNNTDSEELAQTVGERVESTQTPAFIRAATPDATPNQ